MDLEINIEEIFQLVNDSELMQFLMDKYDLPTVAWALQSLHNSLQELMTSFVTQNE